MPHRIVGGVGIPASLIVKGSLRIARLFGIDVFVHWTFLILLVWVVGSFAARGSSTIEVIVSLGTIFALFGCVVLHELGHALAARQFGIGTRDITLLPIGGVARLERMPRDPMQEFWVAVAGPAVNVVIAASLILGMILVGAAEITAGNPLVGTSFLANLLTINIILVIFNMLPAFPMDGGRVLRALLAMRMGYLEATTYAARVGQLMAIMFGVIGFMGNPFLLFIALFVYLGAAAEVRMAEMTVLIGDSNVRAGMMRRFVALDSNTTLGEVSQELLTGHQIDFPVVDHGRYVGMIRRADLPVALQRYGDDHPIADLVVRDSITASQDDSLEDVSMRMQMAGVMTIPVLDGPTVVGLLSQENISELLVIRAAQARRGVL